MATVPNAALTNEAKLIGGTAGGTAYTYFAVGSGSTVEKATDTTLAAEHTTGGFARASVTPTYEADYKCVLSKTFTAEATTTVREMGIFTAASDGTMGLRHVLTEDVEVAIGQTFTGTLKKIFATT
jgi:hypothetical protein